MHKATPRGTWQLDRRALLRGAGVAVALPWLEAMSPAIHREHERQEPGRREPVRRTCFVYFPNGCSLPDEKDEQYRHWRWFPDGEGKDFRFTPVLSCLEPYRDRLSVLGGLSHPLSRELLGHLAGDTWLTAGDLRGDSYKNRVSVDQVIARELKQHTRYPSLVLSTDGGVGYKSRTSTISFDLSGRPIPAESRQRLIFERYFAPGGSAGGTDVSATRKESLRRGRRIVDLVLGDAKRLEQRLGKHDRDKLGQYLQSLDAVDEQLQRNEQWLDRPLPQFDSSHLDLDARADVDPTAYLRSMFDLVVLALQLDLTRVATFMTGREDGMGFGDSFPQRALGIKRGLHTISHDGHEGHWDDWGRYDQWVAQQFAYFVERLATVQDEHGPLLDTTQVLYGSCCSTTHNARNLPLLLVGGSRLGLRHGAYHRWDEKTPMCNLLLGMLRTATAGSGVAAETFGDATGPLGGPFAGA